MIVMSIILRVYTIGFSAKFGSVKKCFLYIINSVQGNDCIEMFNGINYCQMISLISKTMEIMFYIKPF